MPTSSPTITELTEGCRVPVHMSGAEWPIAEVSRLVHFSTVYNMSFLIWNASLELSHYVGSSLEA